VVDSVGSTARQLQREKIRFLNSGAGNRFHRSNSIFEFHLFVPVYRMFFRRPYGARESIWVTGFPTLKRGANEPLRLTARSPSREQSLIANLSIS
jgi:hypothetical protein